MTDRASPTTVSFGLPGALVTVTVLPIAASPYWFGSMTISPGRVAHRPLRTMMVSSGPDGDARPTTASPVDGVSEWIR